MIGCRLNLKKLALSPRCFGVREETRLGNRFLVRVEQVKPELGVLAAQSSAEAPDGCGGKPCGLVLDLGTHWKSGVLASTELEDEEGATWKVRSVRYIGDDDCDLRIIPTFMQVRREHYNPTYP